MFAVVVQSIQEATCKLWGGRADLARAIEKWGGPSQLAEDLAYGVSPRSRQGASRTVHSSNAQPGQTSPLDSADSDSDESSASKISIKPAAARARAIAAQAARSRAQGNQPQVQDRPAAVTPTPVDMQAREKQPIVSNRRRIAIRRKTPKLPSMRQEIDNW